MDPDAKPGQEPVSIVVDEAASSGGSPVLGSANLGNAAEDQRAWHEERIRRRLANEYERAGRALSEVVTENLETPMNLAAVRIVGTKHTRTGFLGRIAAPYLSSFSSSSSSSKPSTSDTPTTETLRDVLKKTRDLTDQLGRFDIFSEIEAGLESSRGALADNKDVDLIIKVKEASRYFVRTATDVGDGEGNATATARVRNAFGGAETIEGNASFGTRTKSSFQVRISTPVLADPTTTLSLNGFAIERDLSHFASCRERLRGTKLALNTLSPFGSHELAYDGILRNICEVGPQASMSIRNAAGLSVKSALSHTFLRDTRDDPFISTRGSYLRLMQEYAGLGGDANFVKAEGESQISRPIGAGCTLALGLRGGLLYPLGGKPSLLPDRFQLGGPTSVRMFKMSGLGPRDQNDFLGGDLQWAAGLSLITPIPKRPEWPLKGHVFLNAGRLVSFDKDLAASVAQLVREPAVSAGLGLMYKHSIVRLEFNVGMPIAAHKGDGVRKGFQVGLGLHFL